MRRCTAWVNAKDPDQVRYSQLELVRQHIYGLAIGYVHQNDHDALAHDVAASAGAHRALAMRACSSASLTSSRPMEATTSTRPSDAGVA